MFYSSTVKVKVFLGMEIFQHVIVEQFLRPSLGERNEGKGKTM